LFVTSIIEIIASTQIKLVKSNQANSSEVKVFHLQFSRNFLKLAFSLNDKVKYFELKKGCSHLLSSKTSSSVGNSKPIITSCFSISFPIYSVV
jgi:hypothetical protein